jgi:hypothetical protein
MEVLKTNPKRNWKKRLLVSTATEGWVRYEWAHARYGQIIPVNFEVSGFDLAYTAIGYGIDDAYNLITAKALELGVDWLLLIEDDVIVPNDLLIKVEQYMRKNKVPIVSGLYYLKATPTMPLVFRGRGNGTYANFKVGDLVWCDGLPMGCLLIHTSILRWVSDNAEEYIAVDGTRLKKVFETPMKVFYDPENHQFARQMGTQDLHFFDQVMEHDVLKKTGWKQIAKRKYPFLCDTSIFCRHIDRNTGRMYP